MATIAVFTPNSAEFPSANFPQITTIHSTGRRPVLAFDASTQETCMWTGVAPTTFTGTPTAVIQYVMASATTGSVDFEVSLEAVTDGDATDLDTAESFDTVNSGSATVPGTAGHIDQKSISLANLDGMVAGDYYRLKVSRDADDAVNDTATGDLYLLGVELRDGA